MYYIPTFSRTAFLSLFLGFINNSTTFYTRNSVYTPKMASLKNGVLLKLLEDMKTEADEDVLEDDPSKPVLLQIRSIIPVLEKGDLWPNRGFFLKVSDSTHALYVSLSEEQNEMILGNKLKLGQYIYVQKLKNSHPVPLLKGVIPIPGRRPCEGTPEDIISQSNFVKVLEASAVDSIVEKGVILEKKVIKSPSFSRKLARGLSDSESSCKKSEALKSRSLSTSKARPRDVKTDKFGFTTDDFKKIGCNDIGVWPRSRPSSVDNDSDGDSVISSCSSSRMSKRRSWQESEILGVKEIFDSSVVKHDIKLPPRSRSTNVSPIRCVRYDSSDDNLSSISRRRSIGSAKRLVKSSNKSQAPVPKMNNVQIGSSLCGLVYERKGAESGILWNSLPSNLVKLGKEVIKQRDIALLAAADALQEACASERLLNSLSTLSQFPLAQGDDLQPQVDKFFILQENLSHTKLIIQSLTSITPFRTQESSEPSSTNSVKETLHTALQRKRNAITWIKSAVALDLSPSSPPPHDPSSHPVDPTKKENPSPKCEDKRPKDTCFVVGKNRSNNMDFNPFFLASVKEDQPEWCRGSALSAAAELAASLQDECRKSFLSYVEKYLDEVDRKCGLMENDGEMAGMMYKVKMVSDWLNVILNNNNINNNEGKDIGEVICENLDEFEAEAYERVRNKIYRILLKNVERTAMAFERVNGPL